MPAVDMGSWDLCCDCFDGEKTAGPVPTLFAEDVEEALAMASLQEDGPASKRQRGEPQQSEQGSQP